MMFSLRCQADENRQPVAHPTGEQPPHLQQSHRHSLLPRLPPVFCYTATQTPVTALESLLTERGLLAAPELAERKDAWAETYRHTPHGKPVKLLAK